MCMYAPATGPGDRSSARLIPFYQQRPDWRPADDLAKGGQVATLRVPLDYRAPEGRTIGVAIARRPANDPGRRLGVLVIPPDDPGNRGIALLPQLEAALPPELLDRLDLVAFDHRFSGDSTPIDVDWSMEERLWVFHRPGSLSEEARFQAGVARKVTAAAEDLLPYASTRNIARDLDVIRGCLGEERISYLGYSYGTYLGAVYTQLFGSRTDRVVLDSVLSPEWVWRGLFLNVAANVEAALARWCRWAAAREADLHLGGTAESVRARYDQVLDRGAGQPFAMAGLPMPVDAFTWQFFTVVLLLADRTYPLLAELVGAATGSAPVSPGLVTELMGLVGQRHDSTPGGQLALLCGETTWPRDLDVYERDMSEFDARFPLLGRTLACVRAGAFWPTDPAEPLTVLGPDNPAESILLVQSEADVFTGVTGAKRLRELFPRNSRLVLAADTSHHRLYPFGGHPVVNELVTDYLLGGRLPADDVTCAPVGGAR